MAAAEEEDDVESPRATSHSAKRGLSLRSTSRGSAVAPRRCVSMRAGVELGSESPHAANTAPRVPQTSGATAARLRAEVSVHRLTHQALRKVLGGEARADDASEDPADARDVLRNARVVLDIADKMIVDSRAGSSFPAAAGGGLRPRRQDSLASALSLRENTELSAAARGYLREYAAAGTDGDDAFDDSVQLAAAAYDSVNLPRHDSRKLGEKLESFRWRQEDADPESASASAGASADLASTIDSWDAFDAVALDERLRRARPDLNPSDPSGVLVETTLAVAERHDLVESAGVDRGSLADFLRSLEREYRRPDYHTAVHAADVVQAVSFLLSKGLRDEIDADAAFALVVAAAAHDAGHPGRNNAHLVRTEDPAATRWNDVSVNENGHLHVALRLLRQHGVTRGWEAERARGFRAMLGRLILSTDMENHARIVADFVDAAASAGMRKDGTNASSGSALAALEPIENEDGDEDHRRDAKGEGRGGRVEVDGGGEGKSPSPSLGAGPGLGGAARVGSWRDPTLALCYVLHCADVSNPARPFAVAREWGRRVCEEFYKQGDVERELGLSVAAFCDRSLREGDETDAANQMAFMDFVVKPTLEALATALPEAADVMLEHLSRNRARYERIVDPSLATRRASMEERRRSVSAEPTPYK
jgi:hypothetical protein